MSFRAIARVSPLTAHRSALVRPLSISAIRNKTVTETVKETAEAVNKKVGEVLASGIDTAEKAAGSAQETIDANTPTKGQVAGKAEEVKVDAKDTLNKAAGKAKQAKEDVKKQL